MDGWVNDGFCRHFNSNADVSLTKFFFCLNLTKPQNFIKHHIIRIYLHAEMNVKVWQQ